MDESLRAAALEYHEHGRPGKISVTPTKQLSNQRDLALAYSPGVAAACEAIVDDNHNAFRYTGRGNLVGVITNGTAVLGLGNIGPLASKPVMEGKAVLFKKFSGLDVFDIEINEQDPDKLVDIIAGLEPTFGGINLEDIKAPECFYVEKKLRERMNIPVFHDDQHGTAIISSAALLNGLELVGKRIGEVKIAVSGAGAAAIACLDLMCALGVRRENVFVCDSKGVIHDRREDKLDESKKRYQQVTAARTLADVMKGADVVLGCSAAGAVTADMVASMDVLFLLGADELDLSNKGAKFTVYIGSHGDQGAMNADVILPGAAYTEKSGIWVNTEGRVQVGNRAGFAPGEAREDWAILRALSDVLGKKLPFDSLSALRGQLYVAHPQLAETDEIVAGNGKDIEALAGKSGSLNKSAFASPVKDFYLTNPIARASAVMAECSALARNNFQAAAE